MKAIFLKSLIASYASFIFDFFFWQWHTNYTHLPAAMIDENRLRVYQN